MASFRNGGDRNHVRRDGSNLLARRELENIRRVLETDAEDMNPSPGQFRVMDGGKVTVIIEYIPNPSEKEGRLPNE